MCGQGVENVKTGVGKRRKWEIERQIMNYMMSVIASSETRGNRDSYGAVA
jgi:hypothetical protein